MRRSFPSQPLRLAQDKIIPAVAGSAHRTADAVVGHETLELLAGILAALIRVMQQGVGFAPTPDRHHQSVDHQLGGHVHLHRPANDTP